MQTWTQDNSVCPYVFENWCTLTPLIDPLVCNGTADQVNCTIRETYVKEIYKIKKDKCGECKFFIEEYMYCWDLKDKTNPCSGACKGFKEK